MELRGMASKETASDNGMGKEPQAGKLGRPGGV